MNEGQQHRLALPQGTRIRDFEFHRVLGYGGFGITYLGWNIALDIPVAIKEYLPADLATRESDMSVVPQTSQAAADFQWGLERFLDEARTLARFQHPNIVRVHHFFEAYSTAYIAMDYVEGEDLSAYLSRKGTLSEDELKGILYPLLSALEVVHRADFLHRDIKPGNIVLRDSDGSPVLLDFGAARQAIGAKSRSVTSIVTPGYAPIEQYSSRGRQGAWTDLYALGGVCYRALTGQVPEDATDRMRHDPLVPVSQRCEGQASGAFLSAIDVALSVDEGDRPQSVGAWRSAFEADAGEERRGTRETLEVRRKEQVAAPSEPAVRGETSDTTPSDTKEKGEGGSKPARAKWFAVVLCVVALLIMGGIAMLEKQSQEQAVLKKAGVYNLHDAASKNAYEATAVLLNQGADVKAKDNFGRTPLHYAAEKNASAMAEVLLNQGADVNAKDNLSRTPLHYAAEKNASATVEVLLKQGADVNAKGRSGLTPLHFAAMANASAMAEVLLKRGADANAKDKDGDTPLHWAARYNASATAEVLRRYGGRE